MGWCRSSSKADESEVTTADGSGCTSDGDHTVDCSRSSILRERLEVSHSSQGVCGMSSESQGGSCPMVVSQSSRTPLESPCGSDSTGGEEQEVRRALQAVLSGLVEPLDQPRARRSRTPRRSNVRSLSPLWEDEVSRWARGRGSPSDRVIREPFLTPPMERKCWLRRWGSKALRCMKVFAAGMAAAGGPQEMYAIPVYKVEQPSRRPQATTQRSAPQPTPPPSVPRTPRARSPPRTGWEYVDPSGNIQGPFALLEMQTWFAAGCLPDELKVRCSVTDAFVPLKQLFPSAIPFSVYPQRPGPAG